MMSSYRNLFAQKLLTTTISFLLFTPLADADEAKHIILFIGDGMQLEHEVATSRYLTGKDYELSFHKLPYKGNIATWDVTTYKYWSGGVYDPNNFIPILGYAPAKGGSRPYPLGSEPTSAEAYLIAKATDSASAATAWATGYKTDDGNIAWLPGDPPKGELKTIAELLREQKGYAMGVVSTMPFSHATPAAHVSHNKSRNNYHAIADEILTIVKPEVVIGGGHPAWGGYTYISSTLSDNFQRGTYSSEYVFVGRDTGKAGAIAVLNAAHQAVNERKKLFGLFGGPDGTFESPEPHDLLLTPLIIPETQENPTLKDSTLAALKVLSQDADGFFLMAEQGDIDCANHANDYQRMVGTTYNLHVAVQAAIDFVNQPGDSIDWNNTLLIVTADHANSYMRLVTPLRAGDLPFQVVVGSYGSGGPAFTYPNGEVSYKSTHHTNELVRLYAIGTGNQLFSKYEGTWYPGTRIIDNTQIFRVMKEAAGLP